MTRTKQRIPSGGSAVQKIAVYLRELTVDLPRRARPLTPRSLTVRLVTPGTIGLFTTFINEQRATSALT